MKKQDNVTKTIKIYLVTNCYNDPNKVYIGKTKNDREKNHQHKFGEQIEYCYIDEINSLDYKDWEPLETYWIEQFKAWGFKIMNKRKKGGSGPTIQSEETKLKISKALKGKIINEDTKQKMSKAHLGKKDSLETKIKKSLSKSGKGFSQKHILNLKKGHLLKDKSFYASNEWLKNIKKSVIQHDLEGNFIGEWSSIREASIKLNINESSISQQLSGKQKTAGGYIWKFKN